MNNDIKEVPGEITKLIELAMNDESPVITLSVISLLRQIGPQGLEKLMHACRDENVLRAKASITASMKSSAVTSPSS